MEMESRASEIASNLQFKIDLIVWKYEFEEELKGQTGGLK